MTALDVCVSLSLGCLAVIGAVAVIGIVIEVRDWVKECKK